MRKKPTRNQVKLDRQGDYYMPPNTKYSPDKKYKQGNTNKGKRVTEGIILE